MGRPKIKIDWLKVKELYESGESINQIAKILGYKMITLNERMKKEGFRIRPKKFYEKRTLETLHNKNREMIANGKKKFWNQGLTGEELLKHYKKPIGYPKGRKNLNRRVSVDIEEVKRLYLIEEKSSTEIGEIMGCNKQVIIARLREHGINNRSNKVYWAREDHKDKRIKAMHDGMKFRPTRFEQRISQVCIENNLPFVYTGDGKFWIKNKNPDFIDEESKYVIEVFYSYWKIKNYGSVENYIIYCNNIYKENGWTPIYISEDEVYYEKDWKDKCLNKINEVIKC